MIYYNLGLSGKPVHTKLLLHWALKDREIVYHGRKSISARDISEQNLETSTEHFLQKGFVQFQAIMKISTFQFPPPISHFQRMATPSRNYEVSSLWWQHENSGDLPKHHGLRDLKVVIWSSTPLFSNKIHGICIWNILHCTHNASNSSNFPLIQSPDPGQMNSVVLIASTKAGENITLSKDTSIITDIISKLMCHLLFTLKFLKF